MAGGGPDHALAGLASHPGRAGLLSDFDGTLARIIDDPSQSRPVPGAVAVLHRLARTLAVVGVVSGRPARFLAAQLGPASSGLRLAGLYGLEQVEADGTVRTRAEAAPWADAIEAAAAGARAGAPAGLGVEPKGLTLTLHWRRAPDTAAWARAFAAEVTEASGLLAAPGRMSLELQPPLAVDKGTVVTEWCRDLEAAGFVGDDRGDLAAFAALDRLAADRGTQVVKVAVASPELPEELARVADVVVDGPEAVVDLLSGLAEAIG